jgi:hypothetical protein
MALAGHLAYWTAGNPERMDNLFRQSGLFRAKWDEKHFTGGETYGAHTIRVAIENNEAKYSVGNSPPASDDATVCIADVAPCKIEWHWRGWIPAGKLTTLMGDPGIAKSLLSLAIAASCTNGGELPDGSRGKRDHVILVNAEDAVDDTVRPRLEAAGADLQLCHSLPFCSESTWERTLIIPDNLTKLRDAIIKYNAKFVVIDPIVAFYGSSINGFIDQHVRRALAPLAQLAAQTGAAILLILHLNKDEQKKILYRGGGSIAMVAASRSVLLASPDSRDPDLRILSSIKCNLARRPTPLVYRIEETDDGVVHIVWHGEQSQPMEQGASSAVPEKTSALEYAKEFLSEADAL